MTLRLPCVFSPHLNYTPGGVCLCICSTESDTEAEIRKCERPVSPAQSDITSHQLYRQSQRGGDIPVSGFGFPLPIKRGEAQIGDGGVEDDVGGLGGVG